ncbi:MAG: hypothetical protein HQK53_05615 [Oligoflexia bacterium]|nr:hypothetical protein [Oligoflexia bacterium]
MKKVKSNKSNKKFFRLMMSVGLRVSVITSFCSTSWAVDKIYYSYSPRSLEVNSREETLLVFPVPPVAVVCQPSNVVQVLPVEKLSETQIFSLPQASEYLGSGDGNGNGNGNIGGAGNRPAVTHAPSLANFLKIVPLQESSTSCAFRLSNTETVRLNLVLKSEIERPIIELKGFYSDSGGSGSGGSSGDYFSFDYQDAIAIFKNFISGGRPTSFRDLSSSADSVKKSKTGEYKIIYYGRDKRFAGFMVEASFPEAHKKIPKLENVKLGELYFSAFLQEDEKKQRKNPKSMVKDKIYYFYILARADISQKEILEVLP